MKRESMPRTAWDVLPGDTPLRRSIRPAPRQYSQPKQNWFTEGGKTFRRDGFVIREYIPEVKK